MLSRVAVIGFIATSALKKHIMMRIVDNVNVVFIGKSIENWSPLDYGYFERCSNRFMAEYNGLTGCFAKLRIRDQGPDTRYLSVPDFDGSLIKVVDGVRQTFAQRGCECDVTCKPFKILLLGGSTVFCAEVNDSETLPSRLQETLSRSGICNLVVNGGCPGATSFNRISYSKSLLQSQDFDLVILYFGLNDCELAPHYLKNENLDSAFHSIRTIKSSIRTIKSLFLHFTSLRRYLNEVAVPSIIGFLDEINVANRGLAVLQPHLGTYKPRGSRFVISAILKISAESRFHRVVGYKLLRKRLCSADWFIDASRSLNKKSKAYVDLAHLTPFGNESVAEYLANVIVERFRFAKVVTSPELSVGNNHHSGRPPLSLMLKSAVMPSRVNFPIVKEATDPFNYPLY